MQMQIKATRYHFTLTKIATMKTTENKQIVLVKMLIDWNPWPLLVCKMEVGTVEHNMVIKKLSIKLPYNIAIPPLDIHPKN